MRRFLFVLLLAGCSKPEQPATTSSAPPAAPATTTTAAPAPAQQAERGEFGVVANNQVLVAEAFIRSAERFESEIAGRTTQQTARQIATLRPDASISRVEVYVRGGEADGTKITFQLEGKNATIERTLRGKVHRETLVVDERSIPMPIGESIVMLEQVIRRAKAMGGTSHEVPIITRNLQPTKVKVTFEGDTARVVSADSTIIAKIDQQGRVLSGSEPNQGIAILRR